MKLNLTDVEVIDVSGKHVYPGIISPASTVGLQETGAVRATVDKQEIGILNPNIRSLIAYNTDSEIIPTIRNNGVLLTQAMPQGGTISGSSSVMMADGWNWEDAVLKKDDGIWLNWPTYFAREFNFEDFTTVVRKNEKRGPAIDALQATFADARAYAACTNPSPRMNLKLESMRGLVFGKAESVYPGRLWQRHHRSRYVCQRGWVCKRVVIVGGEEANRAVTFPERKTTCRSF